MLSMNPPRAISFVERHALTPQDRAALFSQGLMAKVPQPPMPKHGKPREPRPRTGMSLKEKQAMSPPLCARPGCMECAKFYAGDRLHKHGYGRLCVRHAAENAAHTRDAQLRQRLREQAFPQRGE